MCAFLRSPYVFLKDGLKTKMCVIGILSQIVEVVCLAEGSRGGGGLVCEVVRAGCSKLLVGKWLRLEVTTTFYYFGNGVVIMLKF